MVSRFCKQFLFYFGIIVYTISNCSLKHRDDASCDFGDILDFLVAEVCHFQFAKLYNCRTSSAECMKTFTCR